MIYDKKQILVDITAILLIIAISTCMSYITKDHILAITESIVGTILYFGIKYLSKRYSHIPTRNKSLFNIELSDDGYERKKLYLVESMMVSAVYITFVNIFKLLELNMFIINIYLFENKSVNDLVISGISYLLLTILTFIIELGFGEYMIKRGERNE